MASFVDWWTSAIIFGTVIMLGSLGEIITEKSGHLNLGVPGMLYLGGFAGFASAFLLEAKTSDAFVLIVIPIICAFAAAAFGGLLYSFFTVTLKANQNVTGLALTYIGVGIGTFGSKYVTGGTSFEKLGATTKYFSTGLSKLFGLTDPFSKMFLSYGFLIYLTIVIVIIVHLIFKKTRVGLNLRSIGESPATADAAGINVTKYKYLATIIGVGISGLGGLAYVIIYASGGWKTSNPIETIGWLAVALVIFATWKPLNTIWGSYLFAFLYLFDAKAPSLFNVSFTTAQKDLIQILPYLVTIIVLIVIALRKKKENQPPASLGLNYFREDR